MTFACVSPKRASARPAPARSNAGKLRTFRQFAQARIGKNRAFQNFGVALRVLRALLAQDRRVRVLVVHKAFDLRAAERREFRIRERRQTPVLFLICIGAARDEDAHARKSFGKIFDGLFELRALAVRFRRFVQTVEQEQAAGGAQFLLQWVGEFAERGCFQFRRDKIPKMLRGCNLRGQRQTARGKFTQDDAHGNERAVIPRLGLRFCFFVARLAFVFFGRQWLCQKREIDIGIAQRVAADTERDKIDERAFAAARVAKQNETRVTIQLFERREVPRFARGQTRRVSKTLRVFHLAAFGEERGIHRVERKTRVRVGRGFGVNARERKFAGRMENAREIRAAEVSYVFFSSAFGWLTLMTLPEPINWML